MVPSKNLNAAPLTAVVSFFPFCLSLNGHFACAGAGQFHSLREVQRVPAPNFPCSPDTRPSGQPPSPLRVFIQFPRASFACVAEELPPSAKQLRPAPRLPKSRGFHHVELNYRACCDFAAAPSD